MSAIQQLLGTIGGITGPVWTSGGNISEGRSRSGGAGTTTAALVFGGYNAIATAEKYNGSAWSSTGSLATGRHSGSGLGSDTSAMEIGGNNGSSWGSTAEKYNGSAWASAGSVGNYGAIFGAGTGTASAALACGGRSSSLTSTLIGAGLYDGAAWVTTGALSVARESHVCAGVSTAALAIGGTDTNEGITDTVEIFNGSTFSSGVALPTHYSHGAGAGTTTNALIHGGNYNSSSRTDAFNGTAWTIKSALLTSRYDNCGCGNSTTAFAFGGDGATTSTEKYA